MSPPRPAYRKIQDHLRYISETNKSRPLNLTISGGIDSMWMWNFVHTAKIPYKVTHFAHQIRSDEETQKDIQLIHETADSYKSATDVSILFGDNIVTKAKETRLGIEAVARQQRYEAFKKQYDETGCPNITAHHADDQVETILLNLMRGSAHGNLKMLSFNTQYMLYRPFLSVRKSDIVFHAHARKLKWNEDSTNSDEHYDRNWVRNQLIPMMNTRRNVIEAMLKGANLL